MDPIQILKEFGVPVAFCLGLSWFIYKQNSYIQQDLTKDIHNKFNRLEQIDIQLINQQKKMQLEIKKTSTEIKTVVDVMAAFTGNGLKDKINHKR